MYDPQFRQKMVDKISGTGGGFSINFGGQKINMQPGKLRNEPLPYGTKTFTGAYTFPSTTKALTVPVGSGGSEQFMGQSWVPIKEGTVEATLYAYDPATETFIFNTTSNQNAPWVQNNRPISVPRSVIGDQADELPIEVDGQIKKLKDVYGTKAPAKNIVPGTEKGFWSKPVYIPKKK
jgi:hypothetical protein